MKSDKKLIAKIARLEAENSKFRHELKKAATVAVQKEKAQKALKICDLKYHTLIGILPGTICIIDTTTGVITDVSARAEKMYGYTRREIMGKTADFFSAEPDKTNKFIQDSSSVITIRYHRKKNGVIFPVKIYSATLDIENTKYLLVSIHDMSEEIRTYQHNFQLMEFLQNSELRDIHQLMGIQNSELAQKTLELINSKESTAKTVRKLTKLKKKLNEDANILNTVNDIIYSMENSMPGINWEDYKKRLEFVNRDFFVRLNNVCNTLTPNELKLCSYIRSNFSTKEISIITHQSARSIDVARYRLRKKLQLPASTNLTFFISCI